jgi:hypothetical protein
LKIVEFGLDRSPKGLITRIAIVDQDIVSRPESAGREGSNGVSTRTDLRFLEVLGSRVEALALDDQWELIGVTPYKMVYAGSIEGSRCRGADGSRPDRS